MIHYANSTSNSSQKGQDCAKRLFFSTCFNPSATTIYRVRPGTRTVDEIPRGKHYDYQNGTKKHLPQQSDCKLSNFLLFFFYPHQCFIDKLPFHGPAPPCSPNRTNCKTYVHKTADTRHICQSTNDTKNGVSHFDG